MENRVIVKYKDGTHCNLEADYISYNEGIITIWRGELLVGVYVISEIIGVCMSSSEKKEKGNGKQ